jgi:hypothetical protein
MFSALFDFTILIQIRIDQIQEKFSRVCLGGDGVTNAPEIRSRFCDGTEVASFAT